MHLSQNKWSRTTTSGEYRHTLEIVWVWFQITTIKQVTHFFFFFGFLVHIKVIFTVYCSLLSGPPYYVFKKCLDWISNEILLYGTGNSYLVTCDRTWWRIMWEKECIYIWVWLDHFAVKQKLTEHCKSTIFKILKNVNLKIFYC